MKSKVASSDNGGAAFLFAGATKRVVMQIVQNMISPTVRPYFRTIRRLKPL
jgi:hypothetical protein